MKLNWKSLISEDNKNVSQGRFWTNILLVLSCMQWWKGQDIPMGLGSLIATLLLYNYGKKLKFTKEGFVEDKTTTTDDSAEAQPTLVTEPTQIGKK